MERSPHLNAETLVLLDSEVKGTAEGVRVALNVLSAGFDSIDEENSNALKS